MRWAAIKKPSPNRAERRGAHGSSRQALFVPAPDLGLAYLPHSPVAEKREQMVFEQPAVQLLSARFEHPVPDQPSAYTLNVALPRSGSIHSPSRISTSLRVSYTSAAVLLENVSGAGRSFPSGLR